ncbi:MAG: tetratricopeptide repeat protein [Pseudomonadota bacterium]
MSAETLKKVERFESFLKQDPSNAHLIKDLFKLYLEAKLPEKAYAIFQKHTVVFAQDDGLLFQGASLHMSHGDFAGAVELLQTLHSKHSQEFGIAFNLAYSLFYLRDFLSSQKTLAPFLTGDTATPSVLKLAARNSHFLHEYTTAIHYLDQLLSQTPDDAEALGMQALILLDSTEDMPASVVELAEKALAIDPNQHEALLALSQYALAQKDIDKILSTTSQAVTAHPQSGRAWSYKGQSDMLTLNLAEAEKSLDKATQFMVDHIGTWHALGWTCLLNDKIEKAYQAFQAALDLDRNFGESHGGMAIIQVLQGQTEDAEKSIRRGLGLNPDGYSARYAKALLLEKAGKTQDAQQLMQEILSSDLGSEAKMFIELLNNKSLLSSQQLH